MIPFVTHGPLPGTRKCYCRWALLLFLLFSSGISAQNFVHPGIPLSSSDLGILKAHIQAGDYPWKQAYDVLAADGKSQLTYIMQGPFASVSRNPHINRNQWMSDMAAAFNLAMMWYFTGNADYAIKSRDILLAWANTQTQFIGNEANLDLGDFAYAYGGAASILRGTWNGWTAANTATVKKLFNDVYWPASGCAGYALGPANKGTLSIAAGSAIAAFSDEPEKIAHVIHLMRYIGATGFKNTLPSGQNGESGRDQGHGHGMWSSLAFAAEVLWKQGLDLYSELENRLLATGEYFSRKNAGEPIGFIPYGPTDWYYLTDETVVWDGGRWGLTLLHGAYMVRKNISSTYVTQRLIDIPRRFDPVYTWFYKSEDNSTAVAPPQTEILPAPGKVGTGGLTDLDIGSGFPAGSSAYNNNVWTVKGSGTNISTHAADGVHFVYKEVTGNCSIIARVESLDSTAANARAGLMIRSDLTATSAQRAWIAAIPGRQGEAFMHGWTEMRGGSNWEKRTRPIPGVPYWIKIERIGDMIGTYFSPDGVSWAAQVEGRFEGFTGKAYIGLAVCSMASGVLNTATFSNVSVTGGQGGITTLPEAPHSVYAYGGNNQVRVRWLSSFGATSYTVKRADAESGPYTIIAANVTGNTILDAQTTNGHSYYYKVSATNSVGTSADSPADGTTLKIPYVLQTLNGLYRIIVTHSNKAVEVKNSSMADSALLAQKTYTFSSNQHWVITPINGTDYKVINLLSGKAMDVAGNATTNGAGVEQRTYVATDSAQIWTIRDRGNGTFSIVSKPGQKSLEVPGSNTGEGINITINRWLDGANQIFRIEPVTVNEMDSVYLKKLAEAIRLRDTTAVSTTNEPGKFPPAAKSQLNDSITYVQSSYHTQSTVTEVCSYVAVLENAIKRYKAAMYYRTNSLADGNYYLKPLTSDSLWTRNTTNTPLFDTLNSDPLMQIWNVTKQTNGRYKIICVSAPSAFSNYINENAQFGRSVTAYSDVWNSMNIYGNGTSYAVQRAQTAGNGYWYISGNQVQSVIGNDNDPIPYNFPFRFVPVDTIPVNLTVAAGDARNILEWSPIFNLTYTIKRSTTQNGPYTTIASQTDTRFTDTAVTNGTTYYYLVAATDSSAVSPKVAASPNIGQLVYLKFNESNGTRAFDSWGATHGTLAVSATRTPGKEGNALQLNGTANAYATLPAGVVSPLADFTVSAWVKMDAMANWMRVFDFGNSTTQYMFLSVQAGTTTVNNVSASIVRYAIKNGGTEQYAGAPFVFPLKTWVHLAVTQSGDTARLYINGDIVATNTALTIKPSQLTPAGTTNGTTLNYLGKSQFSDPVFNGAIDEFKIYSRALSSTEIADISDAGQGALLTAPPAQARCYTQSGIYSIPLPVVTDTSKVVSLAYRVSGTTSRTGTGADASGSFNTGQSTITWISTSKRGKVDTAVTTVTINPHIQVTVPDVYAMDPAVDAQNTIYKGYGPASLTITAGAAGGTSPFTYAWNGGPNTANISVNTAGTYTVVATDDKGCTDTAAVIVKTVDVRCGNNNNKVLICHNKKPICVAPESVQEHLQHGDCLGNCNELSVWGTGTVNVYPNPVSDVLKIQVSKNNIGTVVNMYNQYGAIVRTLLMTGTTGAISVRNLPAGMYYLHIINTPGVLTIKKIIVTKN